MISVILCTRKRTWSLNRFLKSIENTCSDTRNLEIVLGIDTDDSETANFIMEYGKASKLKLVPVVDDRGQGYADMHNRVTKLCKLSRGKILLFPADDYEFISRDWDKRMLSFYDTTYKDNIFWLRIEDVVWRWHRWSWCLAITREWFNITGHLGTCCRQDGELNLVARHVGRTIDVTDIRIIHHENEPDFTYLEGRVAVDSGRLRGRTIWHSVVRATIDTDAIKLLKQIRKSEKGRSDIDRKIIALRLHYATTRIFQPLEPVLLFNLFLNQFEKILAKIFHRFGIYPTVTINNIVRYVKSRNAR
jgi:hypothetical protein